MEWQWKVIQERRFWCHHGSINQEWRCPPWHPQFRRPFFKTVFSFFALEKQQLRCQNPATTVQPTKLCWVSFVLWAHLLCYKLFYEKSYLNAEQGKKRKMQENYPFLQFGIAVYDLLTYPHLVLKYDFSLADCRKWMSQQHFKSFKKCSHFQIFLKKHIWIHFTCIGQVCLLSLFFPISEFQNT